MKKMLIGLSISVLIGGCAGKFNYKPPQPAVKIQNSLTVDKTKADIWKKIILSLGSSFFVINNLDKDSGFINISYSGDPEKYVDCGIINSYVKNARGERHYIFPASTKYKEYETMINGNLVFYKRKMNLEGRINIIVQEVSDKQSLVSVNTKYVLTKELFVSNTQNQSQHLNDSISFNTNGSSTFPNGGTTCYATGKLEDEMLEIVK